MQASVGVDACLSKEIFSWELGEIIIIASHYTFALLLNKAKILLSCVCLLCIQFLLFCNKSVPPCFLYQVESRVDEISVWKRTPPSPIVLNKVCCQRFFLLKVTQTHRLLFLWTPHTWNVNNRLTCYTNINDFFSYYYCYYSTLLDLSLVHWFNTVLFYVYFTCLFTTSSSFSTATK